MQTLENLGVLLPGSRIGVLLIHGLTGAPAEMRVVGRRLNRYGFTVLCPKLAGHCASEKELLSTNWKDWANSAENALLRLSEHLDVVFVGGLSAGAVLSLYLAKRHPALVRGTALYSITLKWDGWTIPKYSFLLPLVLHLPYIGKRYRFEEAFPYGLMNKTLRERIFNQMHGGNAEEAGFTGTPGFSLREMLKLVKIVKQEIPEIETPTFLAHSSNDDVASAESNAMYVQKNIKGPSQLLLLNKSYHMLTVDQERNKLSDSTASFFYNLLNQQEKDELASKAIVKISDFDLAKSQNAEEQYEDDLDISS